MIITEVNRLFEIKITTLMLVVRGVVQVLDLNVVSAAGIGHIILGVSLVMILLEIKRAFKLNVIKLRNNEPSRYYCLDGIFI
jgi:hypothetical protein